jgi:hypothetical protein
LTATLRRRVPARGAAERDSERGDRFRSDDFDDRDPYSPLSAATAVESRTNIDFSRFLLKQLPESSHPGRIMPTISRSVRLSKGDDGGVLLDVEQGTLFSLNSVGARIVELLQAQQATDSIVSQISREFDASMPVVSGDVADFLRLLQERGLLDDPSQASHD